MVTCSWTSSGRRGFALIEMIVASIILGIAVSTVLGLISRSVSAQTDGERIDTAARLADERLNLVLAVGAEGYPSVFPLAGECETPFNDYRYEVTIESAAGGQAYRVRAIVSWSQASRLRSVSLETFIAPRVGDEPDPDRKPQETLSRESR
ncbi:MAG: type II secretion system protein [Phycisphaerae bacterium]|nr:type II secretion system protein [Phycisphaerae bacterium]